jgi:hypothetical protein
MCLIFMGAQGDTGPRVTLETLGIEPRLTREARRKQERIWNDLAEETGVSRAELERRAQMNMANYLAGAELRMGISELVWQQLVGGDGRFKNVLETGTRDDQPARTRYPIRRARQEQTRYGFPADAPPDNYPKFAYFDNPEAPPRDEAIYGTVTVTFKPEIWERTTVTFGDSDTAANGGPVLPQSATVARTQPDVRAISYGQRGLTVEQPLTPVGVLQALADGLDQIWAPYVEAQIHGHNLTLSDVQSVKIRGHDREALEALEAWTRDQGTRLRRIVHCRA